MTVHAQGKQVSLRFPSTELWMKGSFDIELEILSSQEMIQNRFNYYCSMFGYSISKF